MNIERTDTIYANILCFICAGRHLSFTKAADELFLTQSAVSHRIRKLEEHLGVKLFQRLTRKINLTEDGKQLFSVLEPMARTIDQEIDNILNREVGGILNIATPPSFMRCWLLPRLPDFRKKHPNIKINVRTRNGLTDFYTEAIDIVIYYGDGNYPGLNVTKLMDEELFPVCSPEYADTHGLWKKPSRLSECLLLHDAMAWPKCQYFSEWEVWANHAGLGDINYSNSYSFDCGDLAALAAMDGLGLALGRHCLINRRIERRELVAPFGLRCASQQAYYMVCVNEKFDAPRIKAFRNWLIEQASTKDSNSLPG